jgi:hypothetical protein
MSVSDATKPCKACPWRVANQGKRTPDGWYAKSNLRRLWAKLRRGDAMTCHPTDADNPLSEAQIAAGFKPAKEGMTRECAGAILLQQREVMVFQDYCMREEEGELEKGSALRAYRRDRPGGLTREGLGEMVSRVLFGGIPVIGGRKAAVQPVADPEIGYLPNWEPALEREIERQQRKRSAA